jgi:hypothetical protein
MSANGKGFEMYRAVFWKLPSYTPAGVDLTTHKFRYPQAETIPQDHPSPGQILGDFLQGWLFGSHL